MGDMVKQREKKILVGSQYPFTYYLNMSVNNNVVSRIVVFRRWLIMNKTGLPINIRLRVLVVPGGTVSSAHTITPVINGHTQALLFEPGRFGSVREFLNKCHKARKKKG